GSTAEDDYLSSWEVSSVENMDAMFKDAAKLNQDLGEWPLNSLSTAQNMFDNSGLSCENYSATLEGWANASSTASGVDFGAAGITYSTAVIPAHQELDYNKNWDISDGGVGTCFVPGNLPFVTVWKTDNPGSSNDNAITIPASGGYYYRWEEVGNPSNNYANSLPVGGTHTITFPHPGMYEVQIIP